MYLNNFNVKVAYDRGHQAVPPKIGRIGGRVRRVSTSEIKKIVYTLTSLVLLKIVYAYESSTFPVCATKLCV